MADEILKAAASEKGTVDLSSQYARINPTKEKELLAMDNEQLKEFLGGDEFFAQLGEEKANEFVNSFRQSVAQSDWNIDDAVAKSMELKSADLENYGGELSKKKFEELQDEVSIYAKNLMEVARYVRYVMALRVQVKFQVWAEKEAGLHL